MLIKNNPVITIAINIAISHLPFRVLYACLVVHKLQKLPVAILLYHEITICQGGIKKSGVPYTERRL